MGKRELATVQCIQNVLPVEGDDRFEWICVQGWRCAVKKGEFELGDACVYVEDGSFLPVSEEFEFLRDDCYRQSGLMGEGLRLKARMVGGQISQGLALPMTVLPEPEGEYYLGEDVTDVLGVRKWEEEEEAVSDGTVLAEPPDEIPETDETSVQAHPGMIFEFMRVHGYYITTKMDGICVTMYRRNGHFGVCGKNFEYEDDDRCVMWKYVHDHGIRKKIMKRGLNNIAIQGEFCGPGIRGNKMGLVEPEWYVFTVTDLDTNRRLSLDEMREVCEMLDLSMVLVEEVKDSFGYESVDELLEKAKGKYPSGMDKEGIVVRPVVPVYSKILEGLLSMKVLNNDCLLGI